MAVFCKFPVPGEVKTRLAASIGPESAALLYRALTRHTLQAVAAAECNIDTLLFCAPNAAIPSYREWLGPDLFCVPQVGRDLGARMLSAFEFAAENGYTSTVLVGTDCPSLTPAIIEEAFLELEYHDVVLGPSADGGYYLIGKNQTHPEVFAEIDWSTEKVLSQTIERMASCGATYSLLQELRDLDDAEDLEFYEQLGLPHLNITRILRGKDSG